MIWPERFGLFTSFCRYFENTEAIVHAASVRVRAFQAMNTAALGQFAIEPHEVLGAKFSCYPNSRRFREKNRLQADPVADFPRVWKSASGCSLITL